jgi:mycofactocin system glycosyltransferase
VSVPTAQARPPLPVGFRIALDPSAVEPEPGTWCGGEPFRVLRVTAAGRAAWDELRAGPVATAAGGRLARRFTDAGLAHPVPPRVTGRPDLTVIVPVHDRADALDRCLAALGDRFPVIVVDDGSRDAAAVARVAARHGAQLVRRPRNGGPAAARNTGVAAAQTELLLFVDSDTVPSGDWIAPLVAHLGDPVVAAVAPRITPLADRSWAGRFTATRGALDLGARPASVRPYGRVSYVPSTALLVRRAALTGTGFDARLRVGEDVDLVWRLLAGGWTVRYEPGVSVGHVEPRGWRRLLARRFRYGTSAAPLATRHPGNVAPLILHSWFAAAALGAAALRPVATAAGLAGCLAGTRRAVRRAGLPSRGLLRPTLDGVRQTWVGVGRYATQFAAPAVLLALALGGRRSRLAAAGLLAGPALDGWWRSDRRLDPARYVLGSVADEIAYGAGVLTGCARHRTVRPLVPKIVVRSSW